MPHNSPVLLAGCLCAYRIGNPCGTGAVPQALPIMQGLSMDSRNLNHGMAIRAENLRLACLRSVNRGIHGHIMGNVGGSAQSSGNHVSHAITFARGARGVWWILSRNIV